MKRIVLCADDYGQASPISQGIISLVQKQRLSATSCMVNTDSWPEQAGWLLPFKDKIDIGLHFNLTEGRPLSSQYASAHGSELASLSVVLKQAFMRRLNQAAIEAECHAQIDCFQANLGCLPDFIDGHQHVHQFPVVRSALLNVYEQRLRQPHSYVRAVAVKIKFRDVFHDTKKIIIYLTGTGALRRRLAKQKIPYNHSFAGIYNFELANQYSELFPGFLEELENGGLLMCHPGFATTQTSDAIATARYQEYQYLASERFINDCKKSGVVIGRFDANLV